MYIFAYLCSIIRVWKNILFRLYVKLVDQIILFVFDKIDFLMRKFF